MREVYDETRNVVWQTRASDPTPYEDALGKALAEIFAAEIYDLPGIVAKLNDKGLTTEDGAAWTEESFQSEMKRLGKKEFG